MYHTFQAAPSSTSAEGGEGGKGGRPGGGSRRISTSNACVECRRRKIRCDGAQPCGQCQWYQHPESCAYSKPAQRVVPSRKLLDKLQSQVDQYHAVFAKVFPGRELEEFVSLSRPELINLAVTLPASNASPEKIPDQVQGMSNPVVKSEGAGSLEGLEQAPEQDPETDEVKRLRDKIQGISDDVNGLSLSMDSKASSYVGVSSINAAMKVMFKTAPMARPFLNQAQAEETGEPSRSSTPPPRDPDPNYLPPADVGERLIDSYFAHVHVLMPMIDEDQFRHNYLYGSRRDSPWLTLLNMVLALGSLASSTCNNEEHMAFYSRSRKHMEVETFGSGSLYVLQAFGLLSGYYLHWLNRPNEANGIMGATLSMATAHGLHREYSDSRRSEAATSGNVVLVKSEVPVEIRRRTWWSLYVLDSWASITTGRPALGRTGHGITVEHPQIPEQMNNAQYLASLRLLPLIHNISFCKIATKVQDILAEKSFIAYDELFALDAELEKWHDDLPPILRDLVPKPPIQKRQSSSGRDLKQNSPPHTATSIPGRNQYDFSQPPERDKTACPEVLKTPRAIMHWRYQNLKILMHRPVLLTIALRRTASPDLSSDERLAVSRCRIVASQSIADIDATCREDLIAGWNAVWMMYQAVMVPLVSLFSVLSLPPNATVAESPHRTPGSDSSAATPGSDDDIERWNRDVERSIAFFDRMQSWSIAARKSRDVVQKLYDATKYVANNNAHFHQQQSELFQMRMSNAPRTPIDQTMSTADMFNTANVHQANLAMGATAPDMTDFNFMNTGWGISPHGEDAMHEFWNEMMWDTFPMDNPDSANYVEANQNDWWPQNISEQNWSQWPNGGQPQ